MVGDCAVAPECGASLEAFVGAPNSPGTGELIEGAVLAALTHDAFLPLGQVAVQVAPVNLAAVAILLRVQMDADPVEIVAALDLKAGELTT